MTLTEFLLARIAEDESEVGPLNPGSRDDGAGPNGVGWAEVGAISDVLMVSHRRMLAECEAKRRVVELHSKADEPGYAASPDYWAGTAHLDEALQLLALPYADHPEFREEWRP